MTKEVTNADVYRILCDVARKHPHMRAQNLKAKVDAKIRLMELEPVKQKPQRSPLDMPVARRIIEAFARMAR